MLTDQLLKKVRKYEWKRWLERPFSPFILSLFGAGGTRKMYEKIGIPNIEITSFVFEDSCWYESQEVFDQMADLLEKYLERNSIFDITKALEEFHIAKRKKI